MLAERRLQTGGPCLGPPGVREPREALSLPPTPRPFPFNRPSGLAFHVGSGLGSSRHESRLSLFPFCCLEAAGGRAVRRPLGEGGVRGSPQGSARAREISQSCGEGGSHAPPAGRPGWNAAASSVQRGHMAQKLWGFI